MPTLASINLPTPDTWQEFEKISLSAAKLRWDSSDFFGNGRPGQEQNGVDIWGHDGDQLIAVQCKNTHKGLSLKVVKSEIKKAEAFDKGDIYRLYVATTANRDSKLQKDVRSISKTRDKAGKFKVDILFWEDIHADLVKDEEILFVHYPQLRVVDNSQRDHDRKIYGDLMELLKSDGIIRFLDVHDMGAPVYDDTIAPLREFYFNGMLPDREFISTELEALKKQLWGKVNEYYSAYTENMFPMNSNAAYMRVPTEWRHEAPGRYSDAVKTMNSRAEEIVKLHTQLVRRGRKLLIG